MAADSSGGGGDVREFQTSLADVSKERPVQTPAPATAEAASKINDAWRTAAATQLGHRKTWPDAPDALLWDPVTMGAVVLQGKPALLAGAGGGGKSALLLELAAAVAGLSDTWCGWGVKPGRAVYLGAEDSQRTLLDRLEKLAAARGKSLAALQGRLLVVSLETARPRLLDDNSGESEAAKELKVLLRAFAAEKGAAPVRLVVCDPGSRFFDAAAELDPAAATRSIEALAELGEAARGEAGAAAVWCAVHTPKSVRTESGEGHANDVRGSGALTDGARAVFVLRPADDCPTDFAELAHVKSNDAERAPSVVLKRNRVVWSVAERAELDAAVREARRKAYLADAKEDAARLEGWRKRLGKATAPRDLLARLGGLPKNGTPSWIDAEAYKATAGVAADGKMLKEHEDIHARLKALDTWLKPAPATGQQQPATRGGETPR